MQIIREVEMNDTTKSKEVIEKEKEYMAYIDNHRKHVQMAFDKLFLHNSKVENEYWLSEAIQEVAGIIADHDMSKYSDEEFYGYRAKWHPTKDEEAKMETDEGYKDMVMEAYHKSWEHHFTCNDHHPDHWKVINGQYQESNTPMDMTLPAIIHMISDWEGMSMVKGGTTVDWYNEKADDEKKCMTDATKATVERIFQLVF